MSANVTLTSTTVPSTTTSDSSPDATQTASCQFGATGYAIVMQPNASSIVFPGSKFNVSWIYTNTVTNKPTFVDVYAQCLTCPSVKVTFNNQVASKVPVNNNTRQFWWIPENLQDGKYKLMIVPDGKKVFGVPANEQPCFEAGESQPGQSALFQVYNVKADAGGGGGVGVDPFSPHPSGSFHLENYGGLSCLLLLIFLIALF